MEITSRGLWTLIHGMGFGALYLMAGSGALVGLMRASSICSNSNKTSGDARFLRTYLSVMAVLAWITVLTGTYVVYPWYRAVPAAGTADLTMFPQRLLLSSAATNGWHSLGMEWKEHVAWLVPIFITMAAAVAARYGRSFKAHPQIPTAVFVFTLVSLLAAGVAGFFGAMINKHAPVEGGDRIELLHGELR